MVLRRSGRWITFMTSVALCGALVVVVAPSSVAAPASVVIAKPQAPLTRAALASLLYTAAHPGKRPAKCNKAPYRDVAKKASSCGAIEWVKKAGAMPGASGKKFHPGKKVSRAALAQSLYRTAYPGRAVPTCKAASFRDVAKKSSVCGVISWVKDKKLVSGTSSNRFSPAGVATRAQAASAAKRFAATITVAPPPTILTSYTPFKKDGRLKKTASHAFDSVECFGASSVSRAAHVYRCGLSDWEAYPACWAWPAGGDAPGMMYCMESPTDAEVIPVSASTPLPAAPKRKSADPWRIVLDDGSSCVVRRPTNGTVTVPEGYEAVSYRCSGADAGWLVKRRGGPIVANVTGHGYAFLADQDEGVVTNPLHKVGVRAIVYAGAAPKAPRARMGSACASPSTLQKALGKHRILRADSSPGLRCVGKWAFSLYSEGYNAYGGLFHKVNGAWRLVDRDAACRRPGPLPSALYWYGCMVS